MTGAFSGLIAPSGGFARLVVDPAAPFAAPLRHPATGDPLVGPDGRPAHLMLRPLAHPDVAAAAAGMDESAEGVASLFLAALVGWHLVGLDGLPLDLPFSPGDAAEMAERLDLRWIRLQAFEALERRRVRS